MSKIWFWNQVKALEKDIKILQLQIELEELLKLERSRKKQGFLRSKMASNRKNGPRRKQRTVAGRDEGGNASKRATKTKRSSNKAKQRRQITIARHARNQKKGSKKQDFLAVSGISKNSVHAAWKQQLGGLIRYIVNMPEYRDDMDGTLKRIEELYVQNKCDIDKTKDSLLLEMIAQQAPGTRPNSDQWIDLQVAVQPTSSPQSETANNNDPFKDYEKICNGGGILLPSIQRRGEGPAHSHETWNVVPVPPWAISQSFFFRIVNRAPIDLICEMTIDGHKVAKTVPIPSQADRTIRPANQRYFVEHEWRFQPSQRISLTTQEEQPATTTVASVAAAHRERNSPRYNGKRPSSPSYKDERINLRDFPDPCEFGWTFTGTTKASRVEFYEKKLNFGTVKLDFYYTTGTVKTTLHHPTTGTNQLFRKCQTDPATYREILKNPRYHSDIGYRYQEDDPTGKNNRMRGEPTGMEEEKEEENAIMEETDDDAEVTKTVTAPIFYAKNDNYNFDEAGHNNRTTAMATIEQSRAFQNWEKASKQDWACIHAKFYVSLRRYRRRHRIDQGQKNGKNESTTELEELPRMTPIVNIKAAEKAVLSTEFHPIGDAASGLNTSSTKQVASRILMKRINGLNDKDEWGTGPVFETKLYYRLDSSSGAMGSNGMDPIDQMDDDAMDDDDSDDISLAEQLAAQMPIESYKDDRFQQLERWHRHHKAEDQEQAEMKRTFAADGIYGSVTIEGVDKHVKEYYDWYQQQEWLAKDRT